MFSNPIQSNSSIEEGTVVQVDPIRFLCKVKTLQGQMLQSVQWLVPYGGSTRGSDRFSPLIGDRVFLNHGLGHPVITGFFPRLQTSDGATPLSINTGQQIVDMGNYSVEGEAAVADQNKPQDFIHGDRLVSSVGGATLGLLRGGSLFLRASRAAEIFMSNLFSLVRVVSRNWEHFTDLSSDVVKNFGGKLYRYTGYATSFVGGKIEDYRLHFYYGDTGTAEQVRTSYNTFTGSTTTNAKIYKEQVTDLPSGTPRELMRRTLDMNGSQEIWIYNGTHFTRVVSTPESLSFSWNDQNTVTITQASIHAVHLGGADVIMDSSGIRSTFGSGVVNMSSSSVATTFGSSSATVNGSSIVANNGAGTLTVSSSSTQMVNGSHSVTVTSGGVAIV
jgi:hypothetical protein